MVPLHPQGRKEAIAAENLYRITSPMLFLQGTRDRRCDLDTLRQTLGRVGAPTTLHVCEDADHNFKLNSWSYDYPRFTKPFYFGRAANGMVFILMFNRIYTEEDEIRFSLFKFKLRRFPRPAWDFQYVIRKIEEEKEYGFTARLVWKKFVSREDCLHEYESWWSIVG